MNGGNGTDMEISVGPFGAGYHTDIIMMSANLGAGLCPGVCTGENLCLLGCIQQLLQRRNVKMVGVVVGKQDHIRTQGKIFLAQRNQTAVVRT